MVSSEKRNGAMLRQGRWKSDEQEGKKMLVLKLIKELGRRRGEYLMSVFE